MHVGLFLPHGSVHTVAQIWLEFWEGRWANQKAWWRGHEVGDKPFSQKRKELSLRLASFGEF